MKYQLVALAISSTLLIGCASTDTKESVIEPVANQPTKSKAYNIAAQTILTRPYKVGFETIDSPLKDFTKEEIEDAKTKMTRNVGSASKFFGTLSILTGNFTGLIDVVGGSVASISTSDHPASEPRWIVAVDKSKFSTPVEAENYIRETIRTSGIKTLSEFGYDSQITELKKYKTSRVDIKDKDKLIVFGLAASNKKSGKNITTYRTNLIDNSTKEAYTTGVDTKNFVISSPLPVISRVELKNKGINSKEYYKSLTAKLPKGFYLYIPSFYSTYGSDFSKKYTDLSQVVPAIYTQGEQYEFIQGM
ncbi:hypothetical protein [Photobacterium leiognathi]|uniref:hypothetical protein n=1 Tax=Photobacterium leiognathi TaxID=553611 RepID=UPI002738B1A8|nr:hypothetical protein [Photobacterium leiognathi]